MASDKLAHHGLTGKGKLMGPSTTNRSDFGPAPSGSEIEGAFQIATGEAEAIRRVHALACRSRAHSPLRPCDAIQSKLLGWPCRSLSELCVVPFLHRTGLL